MDARLVHADDYLVEHEGLQRSRSDVPLRGERREDGLALHHGDVEHAVLVLDDVGAPGLEQGLDLVAVVPHPPLLGGEVVGVLDIDSPLKGRFTEEDREGLEQFVKVLEEHGKWFKISSKN